MTFGESPAAEQRLPQMVLVVEDHPLQRRVMVLMLQSLGVPVIAEAEDGRQALTMLAADPCIEVVITDLDMPQMDGLELMRRISQNSPDVGVVVLSSVEPNLLSSVGWLAREQGIDLRSVIQKPTSRKDMQQALLRPARPAPAKKSSQFSLDEIKQGLVAGQFEAFVQPKMSFVDGKLAGGEALARWRHPEFGFIYPAAFIDVIENSPIVEAFSLAILNSAAWAVRWLEASFLPGRIAINASVSWLDQPSMAGHLIHEVRRLQLPPARLTVEITETVANGNLAVALENLARLNMAGFTLSVDDYGTGFSSLKRLVSSPFKELKLDRSFVTNVERGTARWMIMQSTIALASNLGLETVAEGVETLNEWELLKEAGCHTCQGYFSGRPMSEDAFAKWAKGNPAILADRTNASWLTTDLGALN